MMKLLSKKVSPKSVSVTGVGISEMGKAFRLVTLAVVLGN